MAFKTFSFTVEGNGRFPLDMLRYDCAWPKSSADVVLMDDREAGLAKRRITLMARQDGRWVPSSARWHSFGWTVVGVSRGE